MKELIGWLGENWVNLGVVIAGFVAAGIYIAQERKRVRLAATMVKLQIDEIEKTIELLKKQFDLNVLSHEKSYNLLRVMPTNEWYINRHLLIKKLDVHDIYNIEKFYYCAAMIDTCIVDILSIMRQTWVAKTSEEVKIIGSLCEYKQQRILRLEQDEHCFIPRVAVDSLIKRIEGIDNISKQAVYKKIKKLSYSSKNK